MLWQGNGHSKRQVQRLIAVVKPELGTKRTCPSCASRFYDLLKHPIACPKCGQTFIAESVLPSKGDGASAPVPRPRPVIKPEPVAPAAVEEVEEPGDDETAAIEDVDLGEEVQVEVEEADTFLEVEEEDPGKVSGEIVGGPAEKDPEET
jgi:uncharacterized protein (TIGR02300 family)